MAQCRAPFHLLSLTMNNADLKKIQIPPDSGIHGETENNMSHADRTTLRKKFHINYIVIKIKKNVRLYYTARMMLGLYPLQCTVYAHECASV